MADAATSYAKVRIADPQPPKLTIDATDQQGWIRGHASLSAVADDASGVSQIRLLVDGEVTQTFRYACDFTQAKPCSARVQPLRIEGPALGDGPHRIQVEAFDAAGNSSKVERGIDVDSHPPAAPTAPALEGGSDWRASAAFRLGWTLPDQGTASPIAASYLKVCRESGEQPVCLPETRIAAQPGRVASADVTVPSAGEWAARVRFEDLAGNSDLDVLSPAVVLRHDPAPPQPGRITTPGGWLTREAARVAQVQVGPVEGAVLSPSGIRGWAISIGGPPGFAVDLAGASATVPVGDLPEGTTELRARPISGAGIPAGSWSSAFVRIDQTPPKATLEGAEDPSWRRVPLTVTARGHDQPGLSGMDGSGDADGSVAIFVDGQEVERQSGSEASTTLAADGVHLISAEARDAAGNTASTSPTEAKIDGTAPGHVVFLPQDSTDPRMIRVDATDATSGVAKVRICLRPITGGPWRDLPTELNGDRAEAVLDDSGLAPGLWELSATATDRAGNSTTAFRTVGGDPAVLTLPLRSPTRIIAAMQAGRTAAAGSPGGESITIPNGVAVRVSGRLTAGDGEAIAHAMVRVSSLPLMAGGRWSDEFALVSQRDGGFHAVLPAGPSRRIRLSFDGDRRNLASMSEMVARVSSRTTISASPRSVRVGRMAVFAGRLAGGWVPPSGKMVLVQAFLGRAGWQTFAAVRANASGSWSARYRFRATVGKVTYRIRAVIPSEAAYPFAEAASSEIRISARG